ncbi:hypothetical protein AVJ23_01330 [Pseudoponticoccus marisrubri]|uniref:Uncharacterized protein n=1 Tax=Pseudoponticoccus marisrubri TaxID=1685382 RepID=A0A0W7WPE8_9RHOB|nr:hypothetical protein AVJ23_01330 [Pseudoponticoccus marisrubri]
MEIAPMVKPPNSRIALPQERLLQLDRLKDHYEASSVSQAIRAMITHLAELGVIEHEIPGIEIRKIGKHVSVMFDEGERVAFTSEGAQALVGHIRERLATKGRQGPLINIDHGYTLRGAGGAVAIEIGGVEKKLAPDVIDEFADLIEAQIKHSDD